MSTIFSDTLYNSAFQLLICDNDYLRELDYYLGEVSSPLFKSFIEAIRAKSIMMKLCGRWAHEDKARICHLLKVWSLKFLEKTFVSGCPYGYGPLQVAWQTPDSSDNSGDCSLFVQVSAIGENIPMGGCVIISSGHEAELAAGNLPAGSIVKDFDDYQEEISVFIPARDLVDASIDSFNLIVTFYGYDFAWYDGKKFNGVVQNNLCL